MASFFGKVRAGREGKSRLSRLSLSLGKSHTDKNLVKMMYLYIDSCNGCLYLTGTETFLSPRIILSY